MVASALVSWLHLVGAAVGFAAVVARGGAMRVAPFSDVGQVR